MESNHSAGTRAHSSQGSHSAGTAVSVIAWLIASVLAMHISFVILEANQGNDFVLSVDHIAENLSLGMDPLFTPESPKTGVLLNYGFAALLYLGMGQLVSRLLRQR